MIQKRSFKKMGLKKLGLIPKKRRKRVHCKFCHALVPIGEAHRHDQGWVGPECWDDRLRSTE